jgi:hypothetical protein
MPGYIEVVKEAWQGSTLGCSPLNVLYYKLQRTAKALKSWSSKLFSKARLELAMANEVIQRLDVAQENRQLSAQELQLRSELKARVLGLAAIERSRRRQASRLLWLKEGDACTRFFHLKANGCSRKNYVPCLKSRWQLCLDAGGETICIPEAFSECIGITYPPLGNAELGRAELAATRESPLGCTLL